MKSERRGFLKALLAVPVAASAAPEAPAPKPQAPVFQPHTVWRIRNRFRPEQILLKSWEDQVQYCKDEGLIQPNADVHISTEGEMIIKPYPEGGAIPGFDHSKCLRQSQEEADQEREIAQRVLARRPK